MAIRQKMIQPKKSELNPDWHLIDADGQTLGRICSKIALLLQGKHKTTYVKYMNTGDYVVVVNAKKIQTTGNKLEDKSYLETAYNQIQEKADVMDINLREKFYNYPTPKAIIEEWQMIQS